jgi:hypothetical protein
LVGPQRKIDITVLLILSGKGDVFTIRRKSRHDIEPRIGGQALSGSAFPIDQPEVAAGFKDDGFAVNGWIPHEDRGWSLG